MSVKRRTKSLEAILLIFNNTKNAISVVDLVERLKNKMNKTKVYRILERLEIDGVLHSFTNSEGLTWYAKCHHCSSSQHNDVHPHFECNECGKVECLEIKIPIPKHTTKNIQEANIIFSGQCEDCLS